VLIADESTKHRPFHCTWHVARYQPTQAAYGVEMESARSGPARSPLRTAARIGRATVCATMRTAARQSLRKNADHFRQLREQRLGACTDVVDAKAIFWQ
jgi:hypothetical protein